MVPSTSLVLEWNGPTAARRVGSRSACHAPVGWPAVAGLLAVLALSWPHARTLDAQDTIPTASVSDSPDDADFRNRSLADPSADIEFLERKANILKHVVRLVQPTVVHIEAERESRTARYDHRTVEEAGSGVVVRLKSRWCVVTNWHVIKESSLDKITLRMADGSRLEPIQLWSDRGTDIAVIEVRDGSLAGARLGDSDRVEIGDFVLAVGSPFGLSHSVTFGIISAKGRRDLELGDDGVRFQDFLQTDAAINPGNSGGPLLNLRGEVIGINTAIASSSGGSEGIGFAIPIKMAIEVARQLIETGKVTRAYMGVHLDSQFTAEKAVEFGLPRRMGAHVSGITPRSPAEDAQLRIDDVILEFDGTPIEDDNHLINRVSLTPIGKEVRLLVKRGGETIETRMKVSARQQFENDE
ncbi:MAG: PDZ domain-containing protein [Planctomycetes bacterium]|nr:PDZ domain-containing protein [Planctomycetota bacterium]